ncbi:unnamed protein product [marine sediment metagenome]|uniref:Uncharacterized protein n=1 Tax=marine sediment metagenome TaxID=412755 RepID=X0RKE6_9ZZZZ
MNETPSDFYEWDPERIPLGTKSGQAAVVDGVDLRRVPYEIEYAVEQDGDHLIDQIEGPLVTQPAFNQATGEPTIIVKVEDGTILGVFPAYRLLDVDYDLIANHIAATVPETPEAVLGASQAAIAALVVLADTPEAVTAPPDKDVIVIPIGEQVILIHRRHGVPDWPETCDRYLGQSTEGLI